MAKSADKEWTEWNVVFNKEGRGGPPGAEVNVKQDSPGIPFGVGHNIVDPKPRIL